jgi:hypothetical protein
VIARFAGNYPAGTVSTGERWPPPVSLRVNRNIRNEKALLDARSRVGSDRRLMSRKTGGSE